MADIGLDGTNGNDSQHVPAATSQSSSSVTTPPSSSGSLPPRPSTSSVLADQIRTSNWKGSIPIVLTLAPTSLSSTTVPNPIHVLVSRHTLLHVGLENAVRRLHHYAPPTFSFGLGPAILQVKEPENTVTEDTDKENAEEESGNCKNESAASTKPATQSPYPVCWFEDEGTRQPLQWQYFVGVLFDSIVGSDNGHGHLSGVDDAPERTPIPWKIRLHFHSYPSSTLLELDAISGVLTTVERTFKNSLKQALVLLHGNAKVALNLTKQSHQSIWRAVENAENYPQFYKPILLHELQPKDDTAIPMIPVRLSVDPTKPPIQRRWDNLWYKSQSHNESANHTDKDREQTLGSLLCQWAPNYFEMSIVDPRSCSIKDKNISWRVAGITPPLSTSLLELWRTLSHPDCFLYIAVVNAQGKKNENESR